jgi:hypothetical protein
MQSLNGTQIEGRTLIVNEARPMAATRKQWRPRESPRRTQSLVVFWPQRVDSERNTKGCYLSEFAAFSSPRNCIFRISEQSRSSKRLDQFTEAKLTSRLFSSSYRASPNDRILAFSVIASTVCKGGISSKHRCKW